MRSILAFFLSLVCCLSIGTVDAACRIGWTAGKNQKCYFVGGVDRDANNKNSIYKGGYIDSSVVCDAFGGHLARLTNASDWEAVLDVIKPFAATNNNYWIDGNDWSHGAKGVDGDWLMSNGCKPYFQWAKNQPDNMNKIEHCAHITSANLINDMDCRQSYAFVCESKSGLRS